MIGFLRGRSRRSIRPCCCWTSAASATRSRRRCRRSTACRPSAPTCTLHTHLVVREDAHILFGFGTERERSLFRELIRISGVGSAHRARHPLRRERGRVPSLRRSAGRRIAHAHSGHRPQDGRAPHHRDARSPEGAGHGPVVRDSRRGAARAAPARARRPRRSARWSRSATSRRKSRACCRRSIPAATTTEELIRHALRAAAADAAPSQDSP